MPRYRLLALDIDGTLVNSRNELTPGTVEALRRAAASGIRVVLATGRRYSRALPLVAPLDIDAPLVTASGALIKHPGDHRTLFQAAFPRDVLCRTLALAAAQNYDAVLYSDSFGQGFDYFCPRSDVEQSELSDFFARNPGCERVWPRLMTEPPQDIFAGFVIGTRDQMLAMHALFERQMPGLLYTHVLRSPRYTGYFCEINPAGITKWSGIARLAAEWGIAIEEICAVGDDMNDIPMIRSAGLGIAMGNAQADVKAAADRVAPGHDDDGLVAVVDWLLNGR